MYEEKKTKDPEIAHGKPVIEGTRVPVEKVLGSLAGGMDAGDVAEECGLEREDILAAIGYAARMLAEEDIIRTYDAVMVDDGLLIPKSLLAMLGTENLEVLTRGREIVIRPKTESGQYSGIKGPTEYDEALIKQLKHDFEESGQD